MIETIAVILIVIVAAFFTGRSLYLSAKSKRQACACTEECPLAEGCDPDAGVCGVDASVLRDRNRSDKTTAHST